MFKQLLKELCRKFLKELIQNETVRGVLVAIALTPVVAAYGKAASNSEKYQYVRAPFHTIQSMGLNCVLEERAETLNSALFLKSALYKVQPSRILLEGNLIIITPRETSRGALGELPADSTNLRLEAVPTPTSSVGVGTSLDPADSHESLDVSENFWGNRIESRSVQIARKKDLLETLTKEHNELYSKIYWVSDLASKSCYLANNPETPKDMNIYNNPIFFTNPISQEIMPSFASSCESLAVFIQRIGEFYLAREYEENTIRKSRIRQLEIEKDADFQIFYRLTAEKATETVTMDRKNEIQVSSIKVLDDIAKKVLDLSVLKCEMTTFSAKVRKFHNDLSQRIETGHGSTEQGIWEITDTLLTDEYHKLYLQKYLIDGVRQDIAELKQDIAELKALDSESESGCTNC